MCGSTAATWRPRNSCGPRERTLFARALVADFLLADPDFSTVIPGAATAAQQDENVQASAAGPLPPDIHARIEALGKVCEGIHVIDYF